MIRMQPTMVRTRDQLKPLPEIEQSVTNQGDRQSLSVPSGQRSPRGQPAKRRSRITKKRSSVLTVAQWLAKWVNAGRPQWLIRTKRLLAWLAYISYQVYAMVQVLIGGRIDAQAFLRRMIVCENCQSLQKRLVRKHPFVEMYCGACGCPQWRFAELRRHKNRLRKWECPLGKHERPDDPPEWEGIIETERLWAEQPPGEDEAVAMVPPSDRQDFGQPRRPCGQVR